MDIPEATEVPQLLISELPLRCLITSGDEQQLLGAYQLHGLHHALIGAMNETETLCKAFRAWEQETFMNPRIRDRRVHGTASGMRIEAIPDTGADGCFVSAEFADKLMRRPVASLLDIAVIGSKSPSTVKLASGRSVTCKSTVSVPWTFEGERHVHWLRCGILPKCPHDLILGNAFLQATKTLTTFKHRILTTLRALDWLPLKRLYYIGSEGFGDTNERHIWGYLNNQQTTALPDSGSDIMAISAKYARIRGFHVDHAHDEQVEVQFADGSTARTDGVVHDLKWTFADTGVEIISDFYVLEDLPVDVLFSSDFVFDHDVFGKHGQSLHYSSLEPDQLQLCGIRLIGRHSQYLSDLEEESLLDVTSRDAFSPLMVQRELARRDAIRDAISRLPEPNQPLAQQDEAERQRRWEQQRAEHTRRWADAAQEPPGEPTAATAGSPQSAAPAVQKIGRYLRVRRWTRKKLKIASIPLMPLRRQAGG